LAAGEREKVENFKNSAVFWQPPGTYYCLSMKFSKTNPLNFGASSHLQDWPGFSFVILGASPT
jgi:hypothetical protein